MSRTLSDGYDVLALDREYGRACPCATVVIDGHTLELHCWRVCLDCDGCGIHYEGDGRAAAESIKPLMDAIDWYGEWEVREGWRNHPVPVPVTSSPGAS